MISISSAQTSPEAKPPCGGPWSSAFRPAPSAASTARLRTRWAPTFWGNFGELGEFWMPPCHIQFLMKFEGDVLKWKGICLGNTQNLGCLVAKPFLIWHVACQLASGGINSAEIPSKPGLNRAFHPRKWTSKTSMGGCPAWIPLVSWGNYMENNYVHQVNPRTIVWPSIP